jgi:hypothetical protein
MRRAANTHRRDSGHKAILDALRRVGCAVIDLSQLGHGVPDALVFGPRGLLLLEIKSAGGRLTAQQAWYQARWGAICVRSVAEALEAVGVTTGA